MNTCSRFTMPRPWKTFARRLRRCHKYNLKKCLHNSSRVLLSLFQQPSKQNKPVLSEGACRIRCQIDWWRYTNHSLTYIRGDDCFVVYLVSNDPCLKCVFVAAVALGRYDPEPIYKKLQTHCTTNWIITRKRESLNVYF